MAEIVNLSRVKKQRARAAAADQAQQNRALHGRTKAEKARDATDAARRKTALDGARLDPADGGDKPGGTA